MTGLVREREKTVQVAVQHEAALNFKLFILLRRGQGVLLRPRPLQVGSLYSVTSKPFTVRWPTFWKPKSS
ncbi:hypothetical protein DEMA109039_18650 [Deinococcus marmoris]